MCSLFFWGVGNHAKCGDLEPASKESEELNMSGLTQALNDARNNIAQYQGEELGEANTKTALIDPILRALGWHVGNLSEVKQEYRHTPKDNPVDYALFVSTPKLFVEAKALRHNLNDHKWAAQTVNYGNTAGVKWVVLTDGDQYSIYNACAPVPLAEKLFRTVRLSDPNSPSEETLLLLSKDRFNDLENQWDIHFADRQVCGALKHLFAPPDIRLVHLVKKNVKGLTSKQIGESFLRMRDQFVRFVSGYQSVFPVDRIVPPTIVPPDKKSQRYALRRKFWTALLKRAKARTELHGDIAPQKQKWNYISTGAGLGGLAYHYVISKHESSVQLYIDRGKERLKENKAIFDSLKANQQDIDRQFGESLLWEALEGRQAKRIAKHFKLGGYHDAEEKWPKIQDAMIDAMVRLDDALRPYIAKLKAGA